ncbi:MAG: AsmA family protein [Burkholderiaceae bacterium]
MMSFPLSVWIRRLLVVFAGLLLIVGIAVALFASRFDANAYKGLAIDWMQTHRHRVLAIDGPVELSVWPRLALKVSRLTLSEVGGAATFLSIDDAAFAVAVWPLLRGDVTIGRVDARGVRLSLERDAKGRRNIDDLLAPVTPTTPETASGAAPARPLRIDVSGIALADFRVRIKDAQAGIDGELLVKEFDSGRIASGVETKVRLAAQIVLRTPAIQGDLSGSARLTPTFDGAGSGLRLADMSLGFKGDALNASAIDAGVKGVLGWDMGTGAIDAQAFRVVLDANTAGLKLAGSSLAIDRFGFDPQRKTLAIQELKLRVRGTQSAQPLEFDLDWPALDVKANALTGSALSGRYSRGGVLAVSASFKSGAPAGSFEALRIPAFEATLRSDSAARKLAGTLRADLGLDPQRKTLVMNPLDLRASISENGRKPVEVALAGRANAALSTLGWALAGRLNGQGVNLDGQADLAGATPLVKAQARFDALDLNAFLPEGASAPTPGKPAVDAPIDLSILRSVNGSFGLRAATLTVRQYRIADARVDAVLDAGMLRVNHLQGKVWGGSVEGSAFADSRASRIAVKAVASGVDVNALLREVAGKDLLEGRGRLAVDVDSAGRSTAELKSRLRGSASLQLRDGAVKGINLAQRFRQARAALTQRTDHAFKASQAEKTDFSELNASFQIADGVARNSDLDLKSPFLRLAGQGAADIGHNRIDYTARATVTDTTKGQDGADLAALRGLTVPVRLTGPFEAIDWKIEWSGVAAALVRNQLEDKIKERLGLKPGNSPQPGQGTSNKDALRDALKGLFK